MRIKMMNRGLPTNVAYAISDKQEKSYKRCIICIQKGGEIYKVLSIQSSLDGSLYVFFNYCSEKNAYIVRNERGKGAGGRVIEPHQVTHEYVLDKSAKLTLHKNGLAQFSGKDITSGIDQQTAKAKGIGVFSNPLDKPIQSGPTFGLVCWGLESGFQKLVNRKKGVQYIILDDTKDFLERHIFPNKKLNCYILEFFIFPRTANEYIYEYRDNPYIDHIIPNYIHDRGARFAHPVVDIKNFEGVIAMFPCTSWSGFPDDDKFGFVVGGPGGYDSLERKGMYYIFNLICARNVVQRMIKENLPSLVYRFEGSETEIV